MLAKPDELGITDDTIVTVFDGRRTSVQYLVRRWDHALPQREKHELGGRLSRPNLPALAGQDQSRTCPERYRFPSGLAPDASCGSRRIRYLGEAA